MLKLIASMAVLFFVLVSTPNVHAEEPEKTETVVVTGFGLDADKAWLNGIRNAVEQVVGTYVSSDTMVKDSQLIKDEILSYSGGYVKESKILATDTSDGLVKVKLEVIVVSTKLKRKIQALNISVKKVDGGSLFGEAFSKAKIAKDGNDLLLDVLSKYPQAAYQTEVGKPELLAVNHETNKAKIRLNIKISIDNQFIDEIKSVLKVISYSNQTNVNFREWDWRKHTNYEVFSSLKTDDLVFMFSNIDLFKKNFASKAYIVNIGEPLLNNKKQVLHYLTQEDFDLKIIINMCNSSDEVIDVIRTNLREDHHSKDIVCLGALSVCKLGGYGDWKGAYYDIVFVENRTLSYNIEYESDISNLKSISSIKVSIEPFHAIE